MISNAGNYHDFYLGISGEHLISHLHSVARSPLIHHTTTQPHTTTERATKHDFITIMPNGTMDPKRHGRFWDARACCNHDRLPVDDDAYLSGLIEVGALDLV